MMNSVSQIRQLANTIHESVVALEDILSTQNAPSPSFLESAPPQLPREASTIRDAILDATAELHDMLLDPMELILQQGAHNNSVCLQAIARFGIASLVPRGCTLAFADIAAQTGQSEQMIRRLLRHAMTMHIFCEPKPGFVAHTKASRFLTESASNDWLRVGTEEMWPAATKMVDALQKWPESSEPNQTGFSISNNTSMSIYDIVGSEFDRANRFANAMKVFAGSVEYSPSWLIDYYDWKAIGTARVIDLGGGQGHIAMALASHFDNLTFVVQDMEKVVQYASADLPQDLKGKVSFVAHDLFEPQAVATDVILLRWILHNWSDEHCLRILRAQIPVLKHGTRLIVQETCMPEPNTTARWREKSLRSADLNMAAIFNSKERTISDWKFLFAQADLRYSVDKVSQPQGSALAIIEVSWDAGKVEFDAAG